MPKSEIRVGYLPTVSEVREMRARTTYQK